jgi:hypothetical protein
MSASAAVWYMLAGLAIWSATRALHRALIVRRSRTWKLAVTVAGFGLGVGPALDGRIVGYLLVAAGGLASASLLADVGHDRGWPAPRVRRSPRSSTVAAPPSVGAVTELDQAALDQVHLRTSYARLEYAARSRDMGEQWSAAREISATAGRISDALAVVIHERSLLERPR